MATTTVPFIKYHGIGNDFAVINCWDHSLDFEARLSHPELAQALCNRYTGIGGDGLLLVLPPVEGKDQAGDARMRVINADGSEAEMCGNGLRCVAKYLHDKWPRFNQAERLYIDTGAGLLSCDLTLGPDGLVGSVKVDMGRPRQEPVELGLTRDEPITQEEMVIQGSTPRRATAVSMGNPHLIFFVDEEDPRQLATTLGPGLEHHPLFANRTNVEFARFREDGLELWVWERGCGLTLACGTGACATVAAAVITGRHPANTPLPVHLPGGTLTIEVPADLSCVLMDGPAVEVFSGEVEI